MSENTYPKFRDIDTTLQDTESDLSPLLNALGIDCCDYVENDDTRLKIYFQHVWYCTDSWVGTRLFFLDEMFVGYSQQAGRKCDEVFHLIDNETAIAELTNFVNSLFENIPKLTFYHPIQESDLHPKYQIQYSSQLMSGFHEYAYDNTGKKFEVDHEKIHKHLQSKKGCSHKIFFKDRDSGVMADFHFKH